MWKEIPGWEGLYSVNDSGEVLSHPKKNGMKIADERIIKPCLFKTGYKYVCLCNKNTQKKYQIHRLVALAFIPNPENKRIINHKNGVKGDNRLENLEWCTHSENAKHSYAVLGQKAKSGINNPYSKQIVQVDKNNVVIKQFGSIREANRETGVRRAGIVDCAKGVITIAGGYKWRYC